MRVLLRDEDQTLVVIEAEHVNYNEELKELYVESPSFDYIVQNITKTTANSFIRELFESGRIDLSQYQASFDD